jgi:hypothetical protein
MGGDGAADAEQRVRLRRRCGNRCSTRGLLLVLVN